MTECKLTPERAERLIKDVSLGLYASQVALRNGIHPNTLANWVSRGLEQNAQEPYLSFARDYIQAEIDVEAQSIDTVVKAAQDKTVTKKRKSSPKPKPKPKPKPEKKVRTIPSMSAWGRGLEVELEPEPEPEPEPEQPAEPEQPQEIEQEQTLRGDWRSAAWFLERRWPKRWGQPRDGMVSGQDALPLSQLLEAATNRQNDLDELLANPPPELEAALLKRKDTILALLAASPDAAQQKPKKPEF